MTGTSSAPAKAANVVSDGDTCAFSIRLSMAWLIPASDDNDVTVFPRSFRNRLTVRPTVASMSECFSITLAFCRILQEQIPLTFHNH